MSIVTRLVEKAGLQAVTAYSLTQARHLFANALPESFLCAIVDYNLPDAAHGEAIDFCLGSVLPTIVITGQVNRHTREDVLRRDVVDYIPKDNAQTYDYLARLLVRLQRNKHTAVLVAGHQRRAAQAMLSLLQRHNFVTYEAQDSTETYRLLREHPHIKMVITGTSLTDESSPTLIANLRQDYPKERLAIISACDQHSELNSAHFIKSGANDFMPLPVCHEEFLCRINQNVELLEHVEALTTLAHTDYLTGLFNRRYFFDRLTARAASRKETYALAMLDLDHFKQINDKFGHDTGDAVLVEVARALQQNFSDGIIARFGGEEFCVYLSQEPAAIATSRFEAFREKLASAPLCIGQHQVPVSLSVGLLTVRASNLTNSISRADKLLYQAKAGGRNRVVSDLLFSQTLAGSSAPSRV